jgi:hypothetical protein
MDQRTHVFRAEGLGPADADAGADDPEERHLTVEALPLTDLDAAIRAGHLADARSIAAIRLALPDDRQRVRVHGS